MSTPTPPNVPIVNAGLLYVNGLAISNNATNTKLNLASGQARNSSNVDDIILSTGVTIDGTTVGANGVDAAAIVASSFYAVYVIGDSTAHQSTAGLLSLNATTPALPYGYDMYRRIGWILTDGAAHILTFWQFGGGSGRTYYYDVGISALSGGTQTSFTAVDLSASVPPIATQVLFKATYTPNSATNTAQFLPYGSTATNGFVQFGYGVAAAQVGMVTIPAELNAAKAEIQYKVASSDTLSLLTVGYQDSL